MPKALRELYDDLRVSQSIAVDERQTAPKSSDDPFVVKLTFLILSYGLQVKASDIHIEPTQVGARIRYRIDGMLHEMLQLPQELRDLLIRSIKVKANMATDGIGRSKPQDSRIDFESTGRKVDLRLSSFPTLFGDVLALRILDRSMPLLRLEQLGLPPPVFSEFERLIQRPNGMMLVTGPAGSGKTTTLYAALNRLRSPRVKIVTLEDPVEYQVDGLDQAPINTAIGLTFASGLRAILRQDANIILVGEIRDKETAEIAIRAALTGHLVLSTMHTRNSFGASARLIDMGIEPHLILASLNGVMAQRLVRVLCSQCKAPDPLAVKTFTKLWLQETGQEPSQESMAALSRGVGCPACSSTGYTGRIGIFELMMMTEELKQLMLDRAGGSSYHRSATSFGTFRPMLVNGLEKVAQGVTSIEEVLRVTGDVGDIN